MAQESSKPKGRIAASLKTIFFDLDDTLLVNPMSEFIPAYISLFCAFVRDLVSPEQFTSSLLRGVKAMERNTGSLSSNEQVFFAEFFSQVGVEERKLRPRLDRFYLDEYPKLAKLTKPATGSRRIIECAFQAGLEVVIATNPLFPRIALEQRIEWANIPVTEFQYALVTTFESMHAAKPNTEYYNEILDYLDRKPEECIMIGDDWERDIVPASSVGIRVFWIASAKAAQLSPIPSDLSLGQGSLKDLLKILCE
jgi:FMN phosphatase YigB (HAD superfamily)